MSGLFSNKKTNLVTGFELGMSNQPLYQLRHNPCRTSFLFYLISISCTSTIKWLILVVVEWFKLWERTQVVCLGFEPVATGMESANESTGLAQLQENLKLTEMRFLSWPFPPCYLYYRERVLSIERAEKCFNSTFLLNGSFISLTDEYESLRVCKHFHLTWK